jgi:type IV secretory pathway VirB2 component (pilin)
MVCQACGTPVAEGVHFCSKCGAQVVAAQPMYARPPMPMYISRVQRNLQTLGVLWCVLGVYRVVSGLVGIIFLRAMTTHNFGDDSWMFGDHWHRTITPMMMGGLWPLIAVATVFAAALALVAGFGLLNRRPWGRVVAIIAAILALLKFPFGTALGIYTLWVLAPGASGLEYDAIADRS